MALLRRQITKSILTLLLTAVCGTCIAGNIPAPAGTVLLKISGNISNKNVGESARFDLQMLESLPRTEFTTSTPWTKQPTRFAGVELRALFEYVGARSNQFRATALDKYWFEATTDNFAGVPAIVAYKKDDKYMRVRDQGPLWIMMPFDDYPESLTEQNKNVCVWQLLEIQVL